MSNFWSKFKPPVSDAKVIGNWAFNLLKEKTYKTASTYENKYRQPAKKEVEKYLVGEPVRPKHFISAGSWAFDKLRPPTRDIKTVSSLIPKIGSVFERFVSGSTREFTKLPFTFGKTLATEITGEEIDSTVPFIGKVESLQKRFEESRKSPSLDFFDKAIDLKDRPQQLVPFLSSGDDAIKFAKLLSAANNLKEDKATKEDIELLQAYVEKNKAEKTFGYKVLDVVSFMPSFAGELYLTAGTATAGRVATRKSAEAVLKRLLTKSGKELLEKKSVKFGIKAVSEVGARTLQTPIAGSTRIASGTIERQLQGTLGEISGEGEREDVWLSATKAFGEQWVETVSEFSGGILKPLSKPVKNKLLKTALFSSFAKTNPTAKVDDLARVVNKMGYNGVLGEMFEERIAEIGHGTLYELGLGDQKFQLPSGEQLAVELVAFSVPGVAISFLNKFDPTLSKTREKLRELKPGLTIEDVSSSDKYLDIMKKSLDKKIVSGIIEKETTYGIAPYVSKTFTKYGTLQKEFTREGFKAFDDSIVKTAKDYNVEIVKSENSSGMWRDTDLNKIIFEPSKRIVVKGSNENKNAFGASLGLEFKQQAIYKANYDALNPKGVEYKISFKSERNAFEFSKEIETFGIEGGNVVGKDFYIGDASNNLGNNINKFYEKAKKSGKAIAVEGRRAEITFPEKREYRGILERFKNGKRRGDGIRDTVKIKPATTEKVSDAGFVVPKVAPEAPKALPTAFKADKGIKTLQTEKRMLPVVIQGDTFTLGTSKMTTRKEAIKATKKEIRDAIKATKKEIRNAEIAKKKAERLTVRKQEIRKDAIENIDRRKGNTDVIIETLKKRNLSQEDIDNIVLENGVKLVDTLKVKRNVDKSLASVVLKQDIQTIKDSYTAVMPSQKWTKTGKIKKATETGVDISRLYELPYVFFERKGLNTVYEPIIDAARGAEILKTSFIKRFDDAGLWKKQGWFTADRFNLSSKENTNIGKYFLSRQGKGYKVALSDLGTKEKKFVEIFDGIIKDTEQRFFEVAKKNGKTPGEVKDYAPIMTRSDIELIDKAGAMDFIVKKHPSFSATKERVKKVPVSLYETDYSKVASRWIEGITEFLNIGDVSQDVKYLIDSDQFKGILTNKDYGIVHKWFKDITVPQIPETVGGQAVDFTTRLLRRTAATASLGLNYATVVKQALTQIPITIIGKARPKLKSSYAKAFGVSVKDMPSLTKRKGDIAIADLQGKTGRIFTGAITEFDRLNAQLSLNALLDKEYTKFLKKGAEITPETQKYIEKIAQDKLDMWYGGFFKGQRPEAFRSSVGQFLNMFIYPLTSQLNGFYRHILTAKGAGATAKATAEVMATATAIAYMEVAITKLSPEWSDEKEMTKDILQSLMGNIPIISQLSYAMMEDQQLQVSAGLSGITNLLIKKIPQYARGEKEAIDVLFAGAEVAGLPKQIRRIKEGMEIIEKGGITDDKGKMLAPVKDADEIIRSFLRGKYGSLASNDWIRNIGEKTENRRWFVPEVEFLQNGDYARKLELYKQFDEETKKELRSFLSEGQQESLDNEMVKEISEPISKDILSTGEFTDYEKEQLEKKIKSKIKDKMFPEKKIKSEIISKIKKRIIELKGLNSKDAQVIAEDIYQKEFAK